MSSTVDFTASVDRSLFKRAKLMAAKTETSLDTLLNTELSYLVETFEAADRGHNRNFRTLLDFSLGRIDDLSALRALGLDSEEDLFLLMAQAHLPMPRLSDEMTRDMMQDLNALLR
jgi:hypothetical protein